MPSERVLQQFDLSVLLPQVLLKVALDQHSLFG